MKKSEKAPEVVLQLSEMLDYMLYNTSAPRVNLEKELQLVRNFVYIQKVRFFKNEPSILRIKCDTGSYLIAPMLLLPFVENVFKHGVGLSKQVDVSITISIADNELKLRTKNSIYRNTKMNIAEKGGIGLANVRKRLDIQYPEKYTLQIESDEKTYEVFLCLPLENAENS